MCNTGIRLNIRTMGQRGFEARDTEPGTPSLMFDALGKVSSGKVLGGTHWDERHARHTPEPSICKQAGPMRVIPLRLISRSGARY